MSEPTKEEMLLFLNSVTARWGGMIPSEMRLYEAIRRLIKQRPKKNRAFVERWVDELAIHFLGGNADELSKEFCFEHLKAMLLMAGVEVSDE